MGGGSLLSSKSSLVVDWTTTQREGARLTINGKQQKLGKSGELRYELEPGEYAVVLQRRGFEQIDRTIVLKAGETYNLDARWVALAAPPLPQPTTTVSTPEDEGAGVYAAFNNRPTGPRVNPGVTGPGANGPGMNGPGLLGPKPDGPDGPGGPGNVAATTTTGNFDGWLQDLEEAKRQAQATKRDIFITFNGSDWCNPCIRQAQEVFFHKSFRDQAEKTFVLMFIDQPNGATARAKVQSPRRNQEVASRYGVNSFPTLVLCDANGDAYATNSGYIPGGVSTFMKVLDELRKSRVEREGLFAKVNEAPTPAAKLAAAKDLLESLKKKSEDSARRGEPAGNWVAGCGPALKEWIQLAQSEDPRNEQGLLEVFYEADFTVRVLAISRTNRNALRPLAQEVDGWMKTHVVKDYERSARLHFFAALMFLELKEDENARRHADEGIAARPRDQFLQERLHALRQLAASATQLGSGTGFVVADGYVLTNHHVIEGAGKVAIKLPGASENVSARVVAQDERQDIALLKVDFPPNVKLKPIPISPKPVVRGMRVGALGFPLGETFGTGLKLTTGVVSATADQTPEGMMMIDCKVNPGNSGGPLCDLLGYVVGLITAKVGGGGLGVDSYGMARPGEDVISFLQANLPGGYTPPPAPDIPANNVDRQDWSGVDAAISPSVLMILSLK